MDNKVTEIVLDKYRTTLLTQQHIADKLGLTRTVVSQCINSHLTTEEKLTLKAKRYAVSKQGDNNPMKGKFGNEHHNFIGCVSDGNGYFMIIKPSWYTGRRGCKHVFEHSVVFCESLGITEVPKGFCIHHVDGDRTNNNMNNLAMMTLGAHTKLHIRERSTTIPKGSREE